LNNKKASKDESGGGFFSENKVDAPRAITTDFFFVPSFIPSFLYKAFFSFPRTSVRSLFLSLVSSLSSVKIGVAIETQNEVI
jgi:hypothetical protein